MSISKHQALVEISEELNKFIPGIGNVVRCPTCLRDYPIDSKELTEEHIIPDSVTGHIAAGDKLTTILCKKCNSMFGTKQTKWLGEWIEIFEGGEIFNLDGKKQKLGVKTKSGRLNSTARVADDGAIEIITTPERNNPKLLMEDADACSGDISIEVEMPVAENEHLARVGFLTAAYGLWFKSYGYSFVFQKCLDIVRKQIMFPDQRIMGWNYLLSQDTRELVSPHVSVTRFGDQYFPTALIYDCLVILPSPLGTNPGKTPSHLISEHRQPLGREISTRWQARCMGPVSLVCAAQEIILPDMHPISTGKLRIGWIDAF
jgi:hypothetical protein